MQNDNILLAQLNPIVADIEYNYKKALEYLEKAKSIDKDMQFKSVWGYSLYNCCYNLYGAEDPKTKEAEAYTK